MLLFGYWTTGTGFVAGLAMCSVGLPALCLLKLTDVNREAVIEETAAVDAAAGAAVDRAALRVVGLALAVLALAVARIVAPDAFGSPGATGAASLVAAFGVAYVACAAASGGGGSSAGVQRRRFLEGRSFVSSTREGNSTTGTRPRRSPTRARPRRATPTPCTRRRTI